MSKSYNNHLIHFFVSILILFISLCLVGCNSVDDSESPGGLAEPSDTCEGMDGLFDSDYIKDGEQNNTNIKPGQLTASVLFDHKYYSFWSSLIVGNQNDKGIFNEYYTNNNFKTLNRITIKIPNVYNAKVELMNDEKVINYGYTNNNGICYMFLDDNDINEDNTYNIDITYNLEEKEEKVSKQIVLENNEATVNINPSKNENIMQLMFVIDTTGSMNDELSYLQSEINDVISKIKNDNANVEIQLALLFYRDTEDEYVTKYFDFTTDITLQQQNITKQTAYGGGDFPEAVDTALKEASEKQWIKNAKTQIIIHVADAPAHSNLYNSWRNAVELLRKQNIHIITIASSGINKITEFFMRSQSLLTDGAYIYLTDHSGIGNSHLEATIEEPLEIEYLNSALVRVINGMHSGVYTDAINYQQDTN